MSTTFIECSCSLLQWHECLLESYRGGAGVNKPRECSFLAKPILLLSMLPRIIVLVEIMWLNEEVNCEFALDCTPVLMQFILSTQLENPIHINIATSPASTLCQHWHNNFHRQHIDKATTDHSSIRCNAINRVARSANKELQPRLL